MPDMMRTTAPASLTSIADAGDCGAGVIGWASVMIGTKPDDTGAVVVAGAVLMSRRAARRQPNTCCEQTCQRRATSDTRAPGIRVSAMIRALSSADQRRRRAGPVRTSIRRNPPFASSLTSNITIARSPLPQANQPRPRPPLNKGVRAPLTLFPRQQARRLVTLDTVEYVVARPKEGGVVVVGRRGKAEVHITVPDSVVAELLARLRRLTR